MRIVRKAEVIPARLGILAAAFHPITRAHTALAQSALDLFETDEVLFVIPESLPHKQYDAVTLDDRLRLILAATAIEPRFSVGVSTGGLFLDIARECRPIYGPSVRLRFLCGRDAAERIVGWNYGTGPSIAEQLREFELLVAARKGRFEVSGELRFAVERLPLPGDWNEVSSTEVRQCAAMGRPWEHMVPAEITDEVRLLYASGPRPPASRH